MTEQLTQLNRDGLSGEIVNEVFLPYVIDRTMPKEMVKLPETEDNILSLSE
jgi:hypothetical protein